MVAVYAAGILRFDFEVSAVEMEVALAAGFLTGLVHALVGVGIGLLRRKYSSGSLDEFVALAVTSFVTLVVLLLLVLFGGDKPVMSSGTVAIAAPIFLCLSGGSRVIERLAARASRAGQAGVRRALVYGAGATAQFLVPTMLHDSTLKLQPVGLVDDDPSKKGSWISGVKIYGGFEDFEWLSRRLRVSTLVVAIPSADPSLLNEVHSRCRKVGIEVLVCPGVAELFGQVSRSGNLRKLGIEELVGRRAVGLDPSEHGDYLSDKVVLVTGAGGSIGAELATQIAALRPKRLVLLDRDETLLQEALLRTSSSGLFDSADYLLADIRDETALRPLLATVKPDVVFHAAALKHVAVLQKFPQEAWKTNVLGTRNLLDICFELGVQNFINISTDKAADPSSALGASKQLAERLTAHYSALGEGIFISVRFGNVLGSRGSLIPTFENLISQGAPLSVTHPDATRYFMTMTEACLLVLRATIEPKHRESIFVLDMGEPVKVMDIAEKILRLSGSSSKIVFTGLRPGEKMHESLHSTDEKVETSSHPQIWRIRSQRLNPDELGEAYEAFISGATID